jgi:hypothetical protein
VAAPLEENVACGNAGGTHFDKFNVMKIINEAVDEDRRQEK